MNNKTIEYLESHSSDTQSKWREEAQFNRDNKAWLDYSRKIAVKLLLVMKQDHVTQQELAERMGCSQQYVSKILHGKENLSLDMIVRIEDASGLKFLVF